jgi:hypothetical protein
VRRWSDSFEKKMNNGNQIENILDLMRRDDSVDAPADSVKWAKNLFRSRIKEPKYSSIRSIVAKLKMEISPLKQAFGERSAAAGEVRQMLFEAGDNAIDIRFKPAGKKFAVSGQLLGENTAGAKVVLIDVDGMQTGAAVTESGMFDLGKVGAGQYRLSVYLGDVEIVVDSVDIS